MDWITGLQKAIDYIEDHITDKLDYAEIARQACASNFDFQRIFGILCSCTLGEYIRNRRLTLAGSELLSMDARVVTVALKYGYDSPESFGRAFTRFHGISPSQAKTNGAGLRSFSRLSVKLILDGGNLMDYRIEKKDAFKIIAKKKYFSSENEINKVEIPKFWTKCRTDGTIMTLCSYIKKDNVFGDCVVGACFGGEADDKDFPYAIGVAYNGGDISDGLTIEEVPAHTWAIFKCKGAMPKAFQDLWHQIYTEFFPTSDYQPCGGIDFEVYPDGDIESNDYACELWISVEKK